MSTVQHKVTSNLHEVKLKEQKACTLILSENLIKTIHYMHHVVNKGIEWSGTLLFKEPEGDITDPSNWVISAENLILMDVGTSGYTEYDISSSHPNVDLIMDAMVNDYKIGHIHTHHNMTCFFSGVDTQELHDNAPNHNYYLSLIVNYEGYEKWTAKVAAVGSIKRSGTITNETTLKGKDGHQVNSSVEEINDDLQCLYIIPCNIKLSPEAEAFYKSVEQIKKSKVVVPTYTNYGSIGLNSGVVGKPLNTVGHQKQSVGNTVGNTITLDVSGRIKSTSFFNNFFDASKVKTWLSEFLNPTSNYEMFATVMHKLSSKSEADLSIILDNFEDNFEELVSKKAKTARFITQGKNLDQTSYCAVALTMIDILKPFNQTKVGKGLVNIIEMYVLPLDHCNDDEIFRLTGLIHPDHFLEKEVIKDSKSNEINYLITED